ncbi:MAG: response regulator [Elusimicrobiales bacterium]|nr:response regulator [Elusimicrobiales bacterium]
MPGKKRILIVDDSAEILSLYSDVLKASGYETVKAQTWEDCWRQARSFKPDLILLDVVMPGMDGGSMALRLLEDPETSGIPVIFLTSMVSPEEASAVNSPGARVYVSKASPHTELLKTVKKTIG